LRVPHGTLDGTCWGAMGTALVRAGLGGQGHALHITSHALHIASHRPAGVQRDPWEGIVAGAPWTRCSRDTVLPEGRERGERRREREAEELRKWGPGCSCGHAEGRDGHGVGQGCQGTPAHIGTAAPCRRLGSPWWTSLLVPWGRRSRKETACSKGHEAGGQATDGEGGRGGVWKWCQRVFTWNMLRVVAARALATAGLGGPGTLAHIASHCIPASG